jgi:hypothetical protein
MNPLLKVVDGVTHDNPTNICVAESAGIPSIRFVNATQLAVELDTVLTGDEI